MNSSFKKVSMAFVCLLNAATAPAIADDFLIYGIPNYPPYSVYDDQGFSGRDVDLVKRLAKELQIDIRFSPCDWIRCLVLAKAGRVDLLTSVSYAKDRESFLHYIEPAYSISNVLFWVKKGQANSIQKLSDLKQKVIGKEKGARLFAAVEEDPEVEKYESAEFNILFKMLASGRLDAVMGGDIAIQIAVQKSGVAEQLEPAIYKASVPSAYIVAARHSKRITKYLERLQVEMGKLSESGELDYFTHWQSLGRSDNN